MLLERMLENLAVEVEPFAVCEISTGWSLRLDGCPWITFHYVVHGDGVLRTPDGEHRLGQYSLALVPPKVPHSIDGAEKPSHEQYGETGVRADDQIEFVAGPDGDRELYIMCGRLQASYGGGVGLFDLLHHPLLADFSRTPAMTAVFDQLLAEQRDPSVGSKAMCEALMSQCLVIVFRHLQEDPTTDLAWLHALDDERMMEVVDHVLSHPEAPHTVESLADLANMSRSSFHPAFTTTFGRPPAEFVREVRLREAARLLGATDVSIDEVGRRVGFASRSQFSKAFRDLYGRPPGKFRAVVGV